MVVINTQHYQNLHEMEFMPNSQRRKKLSIFTKKVTADIITDYAGADLGGGCRGCAPPPLPAPLDDLRFSNTTGILQK